MNEQQSNLQENGVWRFLQYHTVNNISLCMLENAMCLEWIPFTSHSAPQTEIISEIVVKYFSLFSVMCNVGPKPLFRKYIRYVERTNTNIWKWHSSIVSYIHFRSVRWLWVVSHSDHATQIFQLHVWVLRERQTSASATWNGNHCLNLTKW